MATQLDTAFQAWEFSDDEAPAAMVFTDLQLKHIRTQLSAVATELINTPLDASNLITSAIHQAELQGQKNALEHLIALHEANQSELMEYLTSQAAKQTTEEGN